MYHISDLLLSGFLLGLCSLLLLIQPLSTLTPITTTIISLASSTNNIIHCSFFSSKYGWTDVYYDDVCCYWAVIYRTTLSCVRINVLGVVVAK